MGRHGLGRADATTHRSCALTGEGSSYRVAGYGSGPFPKLVGEPTRNPQVCGYRRSRECRLWVVVSRVGDVNGSSRPGHMTGARRSRPESQVDAPGRLPSRPRSAVARRFVSLKRSNPESGAMDAAVGVGTRGSYLNRGLRANGSWITSSSRRVPPRSRGRRSRSTSSLEQHQPSERRGDRQ